MNTTGWKEYNFCGNDGLFSISKGFPLPKDKMLPGKIPYVGASITKNGISCYIGNEEHLQGAGTMTMVCNGRTSIGYTFFRNEPYWAGQDIVILKPKFPLSLEIALFLSVIIRYIGQKYTYANKPTLKEINSWKIFLPAGNDGNPDWTYMEDYIKRLYYHAEKAYEKYIHS